MILKEDTNMRECIKPHKMVCLALRYLARGETFRSFEFQFRIGKETITHIVIDFCQTIFENLEPKTLENGWKLLRNSTNDGTSRMVLALSMENIL